MIWPFRIFAPPAPKPSPQLAVLGAMRSGTNLVAGLIERHWAVKTSFNGYGWKHAAIPVFGPGSGMEYPNVPILYVVKNPYAFVLSLHRYLRVALEMGHDISLEGEAEFAKFLVSPIYIFDSQLSQSPRLRFESPIAYWNWFYYNLETLDASRFRVRGLNYEDLIADPQSLGVVEDLISAKRLRNPVELPREPTRRRALASRRGGRGLSSDFDPAYYAEQRYLSELTPKQIGTISKQADGWLMNRRGYERL